MKSLRPCSKCLTVLFYTALFLLTITLNGCVQNESSVETADTSTQEESVATTDPLPSWNDGNTKESIIEFVGNITNQQNPAYVNPEDRIATFDNDGTLWSEQPAYFQLLFVMDRVKSMEADNPEWNNQQPYKAVLENDMQALGQQGMKGLMELLMTTHSGMTTDEFDAIVKDWMSSARHPVTNQAYTDMVYKPMLELITYLKENDFRVFIVSGGGIDFMRVWAEEVYGIPKNQIIGSTIKTEFDYNNGNPVIRRLAEIDHIDDKEGKPEYIQKFIGRKPIISVGNSDGDLAMLQWSNSNILPSMPIYIHHTDSAREYAYDRNSHIGQLDKGLDEASEKGWIVVDMKNDWETVY